MACPLWCACSCKRGNPEGWKDGDEEPARALGPARGWGNPACRVYTEKVWAQGQEQAMAREMAQAPGSLGCPECRAPERVWVPGREWATAQDWVPRRGILESLECKVKAQVLEQERAKARAWEPAQGSPECQECRARETV